jgi:hypothetical protein
VKGFYDIENKKLKIEEINARAKSKEVITNKRNWSSPYSPRRPRS